MICNWTLEYMNEGVKHIHHLSNKITTEGVNRILNIDFGEPMSTNPDMLRIIGELSLKNDELKKEIAALGVQAEGDDRAKRNQASMISKDNHQIYHLNKTVDIRGKEIVELRKSLQARTATIAKQKKEFDALQWASVMRAPVGESEAEEKVRYLEKELAYKDEQVAELRRVNDVHKKAWVGAVLDLDKVTKLKFTKLKPVSSFRSIERSFEQDRTYVILDGQSTLYEVQP